MRIITMLLTLLLLASTVQAQTDEQRWLFKQERLAAISQDLPTANQVVVPADRSTGSITWLGIEIMPGGLYHPGAFPNEQWFEIACVRDDLTQDYSRTRHGSSLVYVDAIFYDRNYDVIRDTGEDGTSYDRGICSVAGTVDDTFIELPRSYRPASVFLYLSLSRGQRIQATEMHYRQLPVP